MICNNVEYFFAMPNNECLTSGDNIQFTKRHPHKGTQGPRHHCG
jgi:hypothetical protein